MFDMSNGNPLTLTLKVAGMLSAMALGAQPPAASVSTVVQVPASMRTVPFDVTRSLVVPPGFAISVFARIPQARFMVVAWNGDLFVSQPAAGRVWLVRPRPGNDPAVSIFVSGLRNPHDVVFAIVGGLKYLYVAESHQVNRYVYRDGDTVAGLREIIITGLPDASSSELGGSYGHQLKNIAIGPDGKVYLSIASATNASISDAISNPVRCAIYQYNVDGTGRRLYARGLRNAEGLAFLPGTSMLWVTVNQRDNIRVPVHRDVNGDGSDDYGKLVPAYVDNDPPEGFTRVIDGGNYGWPYANPTRDAASGLTNMPLLPDYDNNRDWTQIPESAFMRMSKGIQAHSAPLGFSFLQTSAFTAEYRNGAAIALHGSWNRSRKTGYKVVYFPFVSGTAGAQIDLVSGWLNDSTQSAWGRPVDVVPDTAGSLFISDDASGTIYKLWKVDQPSGPQISAVNIVDPAGRIIAPVINGTSIDLRTNPRVSIVAETAPGSSSRVVFNGTGAPAGGGETVFFARAESVVPYALAGDSGGTSITAWDPPAGNGSYQLRVTAQYGSTSGPPRDVAFTVVNGPQKIVRISLVNADTDKPISGMHPVADGSTISLSAMPTRNLTFQAFTSPVSVGSVRFTLSGPVSHSRIESVQPYAIMGDANANLHPVAPALIPGTYTLTVIPYTAASGSGTAGTVTRVSFTVTN